MAVSGALEGSNLCGRPEKDDFVDSRGYPTVLVVGRDRFGGGAARQCRRDDVAMVLWLCHGVFDSLAVDAVRKLDVSCPPQAIRGSSLVAGNARALGSSFPQWSVYGSSWLVVVGAARALGSSSPQRSVLRSSLAGAASGPSGLFLVEMLKV